MKFSLARVLCSRLARNSNNKNHHLKAKVNEILKISALRENLSSRVTLNDGLRSTDRHQNCETSRDREKTNRKAIIPFDV